MENKMKEIANMFGVELGEEFEVKFKQPSTCMATAKFTESGLDVINHNIYILTPHWKEDIFINLLTGTYSIERKPWKPKSNERYYSIGTDGDIETGTWLNDFLDYTLYKIGNCYRTPEEAKIDRNKWGSFYSSDEVLTI